MWTLSKVRLVRALAPVLMVQSFVVARLPPAPLNQFLQMIGWQCAVRFPLTAKCVVTFCVFVLKLPETQSHLALALITAIFLLPLPAVCSPEGLCVTCSPKLWCCHYTSTVLCDLANAYTFNSLIPCPFIGLNDSGNLAYMHKKMEENVALLNWIITSKTFIMFLSLQCDCRIVAT